MGESGRREKWCWVLVGESRVGGLGGWLELPGKTILDSNPHPGPDQGSSGCSDLCLWNADSPSPIGLASSRHELRGKKILLLQVVPQPGLYP